MSRDQERRSRGSKKDGSLGITGFEPDKSKNTEEPIGGATAFQMLQAMYRDEISESQDEIFFLRLSRIDRVIYILNLILGDQDTEYRVGTVEEFEALDAAKITELYKKGVRHLVVADKKRQQISYLEILKIDNTEGRILPKEKILDEIIRWHMGDFSKTTANDFLKLFKYLNRQLSDAQDSKVQQLREESSQPDRSKRGKKMGATFEEVWGETLTGVLTNFT